MQYSVSESQNLGSVYEPLMRLIESDTLAYRVIFAKALKSPIAAIVLSQYLYWGKNVLSVKRDGWFYKTEGQFYNETGVSVKSQRTARKILFESGVLLIEKRGIPSKNWYKINYQELARFLYKNAPPTTSWELEEVPEGDNKYSPMGTTGDTEREGLSITENTTENTTEISDSAFASSPLSGKPTTPRGWTNLRRSQQGKAPLKTPRTTKQEETFTALKFKDYYKEQGYQQHGMQFFKVESKQREGVVSKLIINAYKSIGDLKPLIDWWLEGAGEWADYEPEQCLSAKSIERFLNKDNMKNKSIRKQKFIDLSEGGDEE